jgi:hypothetical protein
MHPNYLYPNKKTFQFILFNENPDRFILMEYLDQKHERIKYQRNLTVIDLDDELIAYLRCFLFNVVIELIKGSFPTHTFVPTIIFYLSTFNYFKILPHITTLIPNTIYD